MSTLAVSPSTAAISLYFREGSCDKVYHAQIAPQRDGPLATTENAYCFIFSMK